MLCAGDYSNSLGVNIKDDRLWMTNEVLFNWMNLEMRGSFT